MRAFTSNAQIPLEDVAVTVTDKNGSAIAMRLTNSSGKLDSPIPISVPDISAGETPNTGIIPYATVDLYAKLERYESIIVKNLQIFPQTVTEQNLEMIPLSEFPDSWLRSETFETTPQNL